MAEECRSVNLIPQSSALRHQSSVLTLNDSTPQLVKRLSTINTQPLVASKPGEGGSTSRTPRVAIVGCGKIADQHVLAIQRIPDCRIVALCDRELLMAKQLGERFGVLECFSDLQEMLRATTPDVVHITTPPQNHFSLARQCLEFGSHV